MSKLSIAILAAAIAFPMGLFAGPLRGHPNIKAAMHDLDLAWEHINASQKANEFDEGGHAQKAKEAIQLAKDEVRQAAEYDNHK